MATTLPTYTRTLDDAFVSTWYEIRDEAIDNILSATVIWNALMGAGCFTDQVGGEIITRTIGYGEIAHQQVAKGDVMTPGEPDLDTMALWQWKYIAANVQRSTFDDQKNAGPSKIKDYVGRRITAARDGLEQGYETDILAAWSATHEADKGIQGLNVMIPEKANRTTGTYGNIARPSAYTGVAGTDVEEPDTTGTNPWWGSKYWDGVLATVDVDLLDDMKKLYNSLHANQSPANLIVFTQALFEIYETYAIDISQIIKDETTRLADLGFEVLRFKGKPVIWSAGMLSNQALMLNTDWIEVVYDPQLWFDMTDWKPQAFEFDRAAQILCACNPITTQPRRHGRMIYN
jgi:hypothetical protein